jgi:hypothetical protein
VPLVSALLRLMVSLLPLAALLDSVISWKLLLLLSSVMVTMVPSAMAMFSLKVKVSLVRPVLTPVASSSGAEVVISGILPSMVTVVVPLAVAMLPATSTMRAAACGRRRPACRG